MPLTLTGDLRSLSSLTLTWWPCSCTVLPGLTTHCDV